ncbi:hypothetical protein ISCGN_003377 [Ixodes scapularis]
MCAQCHTRDPTQDHDCTPKCQLCGLAHPTASKDCRKKLRSPPPPLRDRERALTSQRWQQQSSSNSQPPEQRQFPPNQPNQQQWKHADITLIPKPGKPLNPKNLRPISLTSCVGKLFEHMVHNRLSPHIEDKDYFPDTMYGFRPHLSTHDILLQLKKEVLDSLNNHSKRSILTLDIKGAFDNISHQAILQGVASTNCGERTYKYFASFLTNRTATVGIGHLRSDTFTTIPKGTPQGSVVSPLLFNIAMKDLPPLLQAIPNLHHAIYADDLTLWVPTGSTGDQQDALQAAIQDLYYCGASNTITTEEMQRCFCRCGPNMADEKKRCFEKKKRRKRRIFRKKKQNIINGEVVEDKYGTRRHGRHESVLLRACTNIYRESRKPYALSDPKERKLPQRPEAKLQGSPPESGIQALPQSTQSASGARSGAHSTPALLKAAPPRVESKSTASCKNGVRDGRAACLGPTRPKARTPALPGAAEPSKLRRLAVTEEDEKEEDEVGACEERERGFGRLTKDGADATRPDLRRRDQTSRGPTHNPLLTQSGRQPSGDRQDCMRGAVEYPLPLRATDVLGVTQAFGQRPTASSLRPSAQTLADTWS